MNCQPVHINDAHQEPRTVISHYFRKINGCWLCTDCGTESTILKGNPMTEPAKYIHNDVLCKAYEDLAGSARRAAAIYAEELLDARAERDRARVTAARLEEIVAAITEMHRPYYLLAGGEKSEHVVTLFGTPDENHVCRVGYPMDNCAEDEHFALACVECRCPGDDWDQPAYRFWPCATARLTAFPEDTFDDEFQPLAGA